MVPDQKTLRGQLRENFSRDREQLLPVLHFLQDQFGYLPELAIEVVGWYLGVPSSEVYGAATSYTEFRILKPGRNILRICTGLACHIAGANDFVTKVTAELNIESGGTTPDGRVTVEEVQCAFLCPMAPAVQWNGDWVGRATLESVNDILREI